MRLQLIETIEHRGSIGAFYLAQRLREKGHLVDCLPQTESGYDCELISAHHVTEFAKIVSMPKKSKIRIIGGHAMYCNPRPLIPFSDFVYVGEADGADTDIDFLMDTENSINCKLWRNGDNIPPPYVVKKLGEVPPCLNHEGTQRRAWYIEVARGCPFKCSYCELGNSVPYRQRGIDHIKKAIDQCDAGITRKVNLFAPDEASYKWREEAMDYISEKGFFPAGFSSMRVDTMKHNVKKLRANTLIRVGIDGLTEETRFRVGKRITDNDIIQHFARLIESGHVRFKMFMIFGYTWEKIEDFSKWEDVMFKIKRLPLKKNVSLRIKWTPFIPQPSTPLSGFQNTIYNAKMVDKIMRWHLLNRKPGRNNEVGFYIENDGIMSAKSHRLQCDLTYADETYFSSGSIKNNVRKEQT